MSAQSQHYTAVAIVLHWAIAIAITGMIALGWWMGDALEDHDTLAQAIGAFQLHKSIGLTVLALSVARLAWRFANPPPPLPETMKAWERVVAAATHWAFYFLIIAMPLTGWLYVSTGWSAHDDRPLEVPTLYFGLFQVSHLLGLAHLAEQTRAALAEVLAFSHSKLAWGAIVLTVLHVGAALKHQFVDRDGVLGRMVPGLGSVAAPKSAVRMLALAAGAAAIALAAAAALWAFQNPPTGAGAAPASVVHSHDEGEDHSGPGGGEEREEGQDDHFADGHSHATDAAPAAAAPAGPDAWTINYAASSIGFSGANAGVRFDGGFSDWSAEVRFDPDHLDQAAVTATIQTGSASVGLPFLNEALPGPEGFDVAHHPSATFRATSIRARGNNAYEARGALTIKGQPIDVRLPFTLRVDGDHAVMDGVVSIDRRDANIGMTSDPNAEYVSREIDVRVHVEAQRAR